MARQNAIRRQSEPATVVAAVKRKYPEIDVKK
jgi:hypothetical protein